MVKRKCQEISKAPKEKKDEKRLTEVWSKSKKKRMRKLLAKKRAAGEDTSSHQIQPKQKKNDKRKTQSSPSEEREEAKLELGSSSTTTKQSALQQSFVARLTGSRFRELNEDLYTSTSKSAFQKFSNNPELYDQYHEGFRHQVKDWPSNPNDVIVKWLSKNFQKHSSCIVADFGCGDAELAKKLLKVKYKGKCPFKVHSFDLVACCDLVTACDMSNVGIKDNTVDVAVFSLSLMGTNLADFIREAHRVLKPSGVLKIAEVRSRFESTAKRDELEDFAVILDKLGFECYKKDRKNKMFVMLECKQNGKKPDKKLKYTAKPCIYKRR